MGQDNLKDLLEKGGYSITDEELKMISKLKGNHGNEDIKEESHKSTNTKTNNIQLHAIHGNITMQDGFTKEGITVHPHIHSHNPKPIKYFKLKPIKLNISSLSDSIKNGNYPNNYNNRNGME